MNSSEKEAAPKVPAQEQQEKICPKCGQKVSGNFCSYCGKKIDKTCEKCWLKHEQSYNCGYEECPGYRLFIVKESGTGAKNAADRLSNGETSINETRAEYGLKPIKESLGNIPLTNFYKKAVPETNDFLHSLKIESGKIELDGFILKGVTGYEIKASSDISTAELTLKIDVNASNMFAD